MKFDIYFGDRNVRFALGRSGKNPLFVIGINPSEADCYKSDPTIRKVEKLVSAWKFDGFIMLNLYPVRESKPENLCEKFDDELALINIKIIRMLLRNFKQSPIWAAWGNSIDLRCDFVRCLSDLAAVPGIFKIPWLQCGDLTERNNPRHPNPREPLDKTLERCLQKFEFKQYLKKLVCRRACNFNS